MANPLVAKSALNIGSFFRGVKGSFLGAPKTVKPKVSGKKGRLDRGVSVDGLLSSFTSKDKQLAEVEGEIDELQEERFKALMSEKEDKKGKPWLQKKFGELMKKPAEIFWKLVQGLLILNLPKIIKAARKTYNRFRLIRATITKVVETITNTLGSWSNIFETVRDDFLSFNFTGMKSNLEQALKEAEASAETDRKDFQALMRAWDKDEAEIEKLLAEIERGTDASRAVRPTETITGDRVSTDQTGAFSGDTSGWRSLLNTIGRAEADSSGGYDAMNKPYTYEGGPSTSFGLDPLSELTVGQVMDLQKQGKVFAAGRYQIIPDTLRGLIESGAAGIKRGDKFNQQTQDTLAIQLIENRGVTQDMARNNPIEAGNRLSREWAGLPVLSAQQGNSQSVSRGQSYYQGTGPNASTIGADEFTSALQQVGSPASRQAPQAARGGTEAVAAPTSTGSVVDTANVLANNNPSVGITSKFGMRWGRQHQGIDIGTSGQTGWKVGFNATGKVTYVGNVDGYGKTVIIHIPGLKRYFLFAHLKSTYVKVGEAYSGQAIGEIGNTGRSQGEHLHFESMLSEWGKREDPMPYVKYLAIGKETRQKNPFRNKLTANTIGSADLTSTTDSLYYDHVAAERAANSHVAMIYQPIVTTQETIINNTVVKEKAVYMGGRGNSSKAVYNNARLAGLT